MTRGDAAQAGCTPRGPRPGVRKGERGEPQGRARLGLVVLALHGLPSMKHGVGVHAGHVQINRYGQVLERTPGEAQRCRGQADDRLSRERRCGGQQSHKVARSKHCGASVQGRVRCVLVQGPFVFAQGLAGWMR